MDGKQQGKDSQPSGNGNDKPEPEPGAHFHLAKSYGLCSMRYIQYLRYIF
jgi:hypothetical protein